MYGESLGFSDVVPNDGSVPRHIFRPELRLEARGHEWFIGPFNALSENALDTPGAQNPGPIASCDFTMDGFCNRFDMNELFAQGDLVDGLVIPLSAVNRKFDLTNDQTINNDDISRWLALSAQHNGYGNASPYRRGDTDGLGRLSPDRRDVDITDFNTLADHFEPTGAVAAKPLWHFGNFDGDRDVDITDFNLLAANFSPGGYNNIQPVQPLKQSVPEPASLVLFAAGVLFVLARSLKRV